MTEKNKGGRPAIVLTSDQKAQIEALAAFLTSEQIADYLGISRTVFYDIMKRDEEVSERYKRGRAYEVVDYARNLRAQSDSGNTAATIFYLKTQAGWKEEDTSKNDAAPDLNISFSVNEPVGDIRITKGGD
jgi:IS30 family transposase